MRLLVLIDQYFKQSLSWEEPCDGVLWPAAPHLVLLFVLQFEADRRAFIITINSFGTELSKEDRAKLFPHCGKLYPEGLAQLARADDYEQVKAVADFYPVSLNVSFFLSVFYSSCLGLFFLYIKHSFINCCHCCEGVQAAVRGCRKQPRRQNPGGPFLRAWGEMHHGICSPI